MTNLENQNNPNLIDIVIGDSKELEESSPKLPITNDEEKSFLKKDRKSKINKKKSFITN